jgi:hypothetical protein
LKTLKLCLNELKTFYGNLHLPTLPSSDGINLGNDVLSKVHVTLMTNRLDDRPLLHLLLSLLAPFSRLSARHPCCIYASFNILAPLFAMLFSFLSCNNIIKDGETLRDLPAIHLHQSLVAEDIRTQRLETSRNEPRWR